MRKQFSNKEILLHAEQLNNIFLQSNKDINLPIKINFYLQKNIKAFLSAAQDINELRLKVGEKYGEFNAEDNSYQIKDPQKQLLAQHELDDLLSIDQIIDVYMVSLSDLMQDTQLTVAQMNAMLFMINDDTTNIEDNLFVEE